VTRLGSQLVVLGDAHLGAAPPATEEALLAFLERVPGLGDCLLINGDLFDFWFAYRRVIPRAGFPVASALAVLRRKLPIAMTGGNHDRWGDSFWEDDLDIRFGSESLRFELGSQVVFAVHGDGLAEQTIGGRIVHRVVRHPLTAAVFRALPADLGFRLADRLSGTLGDPGTNSEGLERAAEAQEAWAEAKLRADSSIGLLVMGHTHRPRLSEPAPGRRFLNPGAWCDGWRYAVATDRKVELRTWNG
jgi:UDP-2,3-diacylglucosamine hydrolase